MTSEERKAKLAEVEAELDRFLSKPIPRAKPQAVVAMVSPKMAEAVRSNPDSLRLSAHSADNVAVVDRPRRIEVLEVLEVDGLGRPALAQRYEAATGAWNIVELVEGYRRPPGAVSDYSPTDRLRRDD